MRNTYYFTILAELSASYEEKLIWVMVERWIECFTQTFLTFVSHDWWRMQESLSCFVDLCNRRKWSRYPW